MVQKVKQSFNSMSIEIMSKLRIKIPYSLLACL
jgi:hypothetical protein